MKILFKGEGRPQRFKLPHCWAAVACLAFIWSLGCASNTSRTIAVIPRTSGTMLWEPEHGGAQTAAHETGIRIYWNAPTREDDVGGQVALIERVIAGNYQGLVLAPDQALALITPVRRAVAHGLPTVIIGSPMPIPAGDKLFYILNDEEEGGRIAARRVGLLLHGRGTIAILGINPDITGIMTRARSFEQFLVENYPDIHIVEKRMGSFSVPHEQQMAEETLKSNPGLNAIVALMWTSVRGVISTIDSSPGSRPIKVIGFDPDGLPFDAKHLDSVVVQNTREMGDRAVRLLDAQFHGRSVPSLIKLEPVLVTRENVNSDEVRSMTSMDWRAGSLHANWSINP